MYKLVNLRLGMFSKNINKIKNKIKLKNIELQMKLQITKIKLREKKEITKPFEKNTLQHLYKKVKENNCTFGQNSNTNLSK